MSFLLFVLKWNGQECCGYIYGKRWNAPPFSTQFMATANVASSANTTTCRVYLAPNTRAISGFKRFALAYIVIGTMAALPSLYAIDAPFISFLLTETAAITPTLAIHHISKRYVARIDAFVDTHQKRPIQHAMADPNDPHVRLRVYQLNWFGRPYSFDIQPQELKCISASGEKMKAWMYNWQVVDKDAKEGYRGLFIESKVLAENPLGQKLYQRIVGEALKV